jgi:hypothetical protein
VTTSFDAIALAFPKSKPWGAFALEAMDLLSIKYLILKEKLCDSISTKEE